ncbi:Uncharacterised protein [Moraxella caviae]|nr:Uncharacterised protein [Moraxella caviae]
MRSAAKYWRLPSPSQLGQAPAGLLKLNNLGSSSLTARSHTGQECLAERICSSSPFGLPSMWYKIAKSEPNLSAVSRLSATRFPKSSRTLNLSTTTSMLCFLFFSRLGSSSVSYTTSSMRTLVKPWADSWSKSALCSPLRSRTTGASSMSFVPSGNAKMPSTISLTVCATIGKSCSGQCGTPTRANKRRR